MKLKFLEKEKKKKGIYFGCWSSRLRLPVCGSSRLDAGGEDGMEETGLLAERMEWRKNRVRGTEEPKNRRSPVRTGKEKQKVEED